MLLLFLLVFIFFFVFNSVSFVHLTRDARVKLKVEQVARPLVDLDLGIGL